MTGTDPKRVSFILPEIITANTLEKVKCLNVESGGSDSQLYFAEKHK